MLHGICIGGKIDTIRLGDGRWNDLWVPDTYLVNEKEADFHNIMVPNRVLILNSTGHVFYTSKVTATLSCPMNFQRYPLDVQKCPMKFESYGYTDDKMVFESLDPPIEMDPGVKLPQFTLVDTQVRSYTPNYDGYTAQRKFHRLEIYFVLKRDIVYFLMRVYMPSTLIVILSWVSFWVSLDAVAERVSLGLLVVLTMATWMTGAQSNLPPVSYVKALDTWLTVCLMFVFASLLEFGLASFILGEKVGKNNRLNRPSQSGNARKKINTDIENQLGNENDDNKNVEILDVVQHHRRRKAEKIDKLSKIIFPVTFILFTLGYWLGYLLPPQLEE